MAPTPNDIEAEAARARAVAQSTAIIERAEVDARAVLAAAEADAAAIRARAELEAEEHVRRSEADREEAQLLLQAARAEADELLAQASELRRRTEQDTLRRLLATRADLHDAIERLREMAEPVLDLTDSGVAASRSGAGPAPAPDGPDVVADALVRARSGGVASAPEAPVVVAAAPDDGGDPVSTLVRSAIGRAVDSAARTGSGWSGDRPSEWREQLRDGRSLL